MKNGWAGDLADRVSGEDCGGTIAGTGTFVAASSIYKTPCPSVAPLACCTTSTGCGGSAEAICCGTGCKGPNYNGVCSNTVWSGNLTKLADPAYSSDADACGGIAGVPTTGATGVLCCQDPPISGY